MRRSNSSLRLFSLGFELGMSFRDILFFTFGEIVEMWLDRKAGEIKKWNAR